VADNDNKCRNCGDREIKHEASGRRKCLLCPCPGFALEFSIADTIATLRIELANEKRALADAEKEVQHAYRERDDLRAALAAAQARATEAEAKASAVVRELERERETLAATRRERDEALSDKREVLRSLEETLREMATAALAAEAALEQARGLAKRLRDALHHWAGPPNDPASTWRPLSVRELPAETDRFLAAPAPAPKADVEHFAAAMHAPGDCAVCERTRRLILANDRATVTIYDHAALAVTPSTSSPEPLPGCECGNPPTVHTTTAHGPVLAAPAPAPASEAGKCPGPECEAVACTRQPAAPPPSGQGERCTHEGIGLPGCLTCDPRTRSEGGPRPDAPPAFAPGDRVVCVDASPEEVSGLVRGETYIAGTNEPAIAESGWVEIEGIGWLYASRFRPAPTHTCPAGPCAACAGMESR
jgi:hypothetical protein